MNTTESIRSRVCELPDGQPVTMQEFLAFGSRASVDQALARLVKEGTLSRPARGVYVRPKKNAYVGDVPPDPSMIAEAIARESGSVIQIHGAEAARRMGFSTQVPVRPIFYTSGPCRRFRLGEMEVFLKRVSPRKVMLAGRPAGVALTALWYLGRRNVDEEAVERVRSRLSQEEFAALLSVLPSMPGWMRTVFTDYARKPNRD